MLRFRPLQELLLLYLRKEAELLRPLLAVQYHWFPLLKEWMLWPA